MKTPIHSINIDFTHASEARLLHSILASWMYPVSGSEEDTYLITVQRQLEEAIELLESLEV